MKKRAAYGIALAMAFATLPACSWTFSSARYAGLAENPDLDCIERNLSAMDDVRVTSTWSRSGDGIMLAPKPFAKSFSFSLLYEAREGFGGQLLVNMINDEATELYIYQHFPAENVTSRRKLTCTQEDLDYASLLMDEIYETAKSVCGLQVNERRQSRTVYKSKRCPLREG